MISLLLVPARVIRFLGWLALMHTSRRANRVSTYDGFMESPLRWLDHCWADFAARLYEVLFPAGR
jgi:hypothetical protein